MHKRHSASRRFHKTIQYQRLMPLNTLIFYACILYTVYTYLYNMYIYVDHQRIQRQLQHSATTNAKQLQQIHADGI